VAKPKKKQSKKDIIIGQHLKHPDWTPTQIHKAVNRGARKISVGYVHDVLKTHEILRKQAERVAADKRVAEHYAGPPPESIDISTDPDNPFGPTFDVDDATREALERLATEEPTDWSTGRPLSETMTREDLRDTIEAVTGVSSKITKAQVFAEAEAAAARRLEIALSACSD